MKKISKYITIIAILFLARFLCIKEKKTVLSFLGLIQNKGRTPNRNSKIKKLPVIKDSTKLISIIDKTPTKQYITYVYHSSICSYCSLITDALKDNEHVKMIKINDDSKLEDLIKTDKPIVVILKNINKEDSVERSKFYYELQKKGGKVRVPALEINNHIMYESKEILAFYKHLLSKFEN
ncbi:conserved Plasmodium protein, unknown function [Plasmodium berghei]|uniref:Uncharacterized protein n=2 Tax=Plasmodium berghei TaxID=5821 RepID=A0A509AT83_PLABA|nr:conserved Plasmodium protein, unknown function [Plasmodium berghei ANKA]CXJ05810.1 conserved Plasmodium protein, unknown function [Plasmodium berghei]SCL98861.1 conserved Plasmodium protein, unknown function [Plasmodium berghei]SCM16918.1 conserved Plasmodium protein, unknown function [Plasmodium berghei]SCM18716.1 conserved Plasmodium protein, unknown function [Plasmodium berghei]SCN28152.1 conserved Plasmodium protein, unknown function [Plasmodium berghei]|eukprot:XP_034423801.1 conserved Plasmodium protein, unknown function [Plasmodium berghei ANKA]